MVENKKFYDLSVDQRLKDLSIKCDLSDAELNAINGASGLDLEQADHMIENVVGLYSLPVGIAQNFAVNGRDVLVPMVIEEPSVVAAASFMARLAKNGGGFKASVSAPEMIGQIQVLDIQDTEEALQALTKNKSKLLKEIDDLDPVLKKLGGGPRDLIFRKIKTSVGAMVIIHLVYDVRDAMGANAVNTAVERLAPLVESITGGRVLLRILSNLADRRLAKAECKIPLDSLKFGDFSPETVRDGIIDAWAFAEADPYRAATHNKGIMNGIDAVLLATGNDWRAVEAGAHAYAARTGKYTSLTKWEKDESGDLIGTLEMPMAVGIIGGATRVHPGARAALKIMGVESAAQLAEIIVSVGLAQNLAALRALSTEGIQKGHMSLHARQVAAAAGAEGDMIERIAAQMVADKQIRIDYAELLLEKSKKI